MSPFPARAIARVPGTWGELVQGSLDGVDFLITCPVDLWVEAAARSGEGTGWQVPVGRKKVAAALRGLPGAGRVRIRSRLRPGAGMGSSTADLAAALAAVDALRGVRPEPERIFRQCLAVEPTDGLMLPGIALVDHRRGHRLELLGPPPPLAILGIDPGGQVPTQVFNRWPELEEANRRKEPAVREAHDIARAALASGDAAALAAAATLSAAAHQEILPNPLWERAAALAREVGALGANVAHSGVVVGLLFDAWRADLVAARTFVEKRLGRRAYVLRLVAGGVRAARLDAHSRLMGPAP